MAAKSCGGCTLCCKLERITELHKPRNQYCTHCVVAEGCAIYADRPRSCSGFACLWLTSPELPDDLRPDRVHLYVAGDPAGGVVRVMSDRDVPNAWRMGGGAQVMAYVSEELDLHAIVNEGDQINFVAGRHRPRPEQLVVEWTL